MKPANVERKYQIMFTKQMNGSFTTRMSVPYDLLRDIGITPLDKTVKLERVENGILIRKA